MAEFKSWTVGDVRITRVLEMPPIPMPPAFLFTAATEEDLKRHDWMTPHFADDEGRMLLSLHAFVVESQGRRIVVDTCVGNDKPRGDSMFSMLKGRFLEDLAEAGFPRESIDLVLCTHMHVDHIGWNTILVDGQWVPTFPNARHLFARAEFEHWTANPDTHFGDTFGDSVQPVVDAGLHELVEPGYRPTDELELISTPGHTPGHVSVMIRSRGQEAVITGDMIHHPLQIAEPQHCTHFCTQPERAVATRHRFLGEMADRPVLVLGTHFAGPTAGWIRRSGQAWCFDVGAPAPAEAAP